MYCREAPCCRQRDKTYDRQQSSWLPNSTAAKRNWRRRPPSSCRLLVLLDRRYTTLTVIQRLREVSATIDWGKRHSSERWDHTQIIIVTTDTANLFFRTKTQCATAMFESPVVLHIYVSPTSEDIKPYIIIHSSPVKSFTLNSRWILTVLIMWQASSFWWAVVEMMMM